MNKKITIVSTSDRGGAGKAATRLHKGLLNIGADSRILYLIQYDKSTPSSAEFLSEKGKFSELYRKLKLGLKYYGNKLSLYGREFTQEIFTYIDTYFDITKHHFIQEADVINLHWVAHFLDWKSFFAKIDKPIYWTLHDQNPFTGGCHYSFDCRNYESNCIKCPQIKGSYLNSSSNNQLKSKTEFVKNKNISIITPSKWLSELSMKSSVFKDKPHFVVNNGLETEELVAYEKKEAREKLNLPLNKRIVLFVSDDLNKEHKGFRILLEALEQLENLDLVLLSIGGGKSDTKLNSHYHLGYINNQEKLSLVYSAADVFVNPSKMDNFPNTIIESQVCGTPVIGFPLCGIKEMIESGKNGILANEVNADGIKSAINQFFKSSFDNKQIANEAKNYFTIERMAKEYYEVFNNQA